MRRADPAIPVILLPTRPPAKPCHPADQDGELMNTPVNDPAWCADTGVVAATFGGILASGFLSAPVASADPNPPGLCTQNQGDSSGLPPCTNKVQFWTECNKAYPYGGAPLAGCYTMHGVPAPTPQLPYNGLGPNS